MSDQGAGVLKTMKKDLQSKQMTSLQAGTKKGSNLGKFIPQFLKDQVADVQVSKKQMLDITLFCGGIYCMYKFGGVVSEQIDNFMPNEEQMQKMMQEM